MIDFTTLQVVPIPPSIISLQKSNTILQNENKAFRNIVIFIIIGGVIIIGYNILKKIDDNEQNVRRKL